MLDRFIEKLNCLDLLIYFPTSKNLNHQKVKSLTGFQASFR
jgi:hypothetical protein